MMLASHLLHEQSFLAVTTMGRPSDEPIREGVLPFGIRLRLRVLEFLYLAHQGIEDFREKRRGGGELLRRPLLPLLPISHPFHDAFVHHLEGGDEVVLRADPGLQLVRELDTLRLQPGAVQEEFRRALRLLVEPRLRFLPLPGGNHAEGLRRGSNSWAALPVAAILEDLRRESRVETEGLKLLFEVLEDVLVLGGREVLIEQPVDDLAVHDHVFVELHTRLTGSHLARGLGLLTAGDFLPKLLVVVFELLEALELLIEVEAN